jgi:transposase
MAITQGGILMATLGIDVSKLTLDVALLADNGQQYTRKLKNTATGLQELPPWLANHAVTTVHVCMEATNVYWEAAAEFCYAQGWEVSVVNPARIKGFAQSQLQRHKTDPVDAQTIAVFCAKLAPRRWHPPAPELRQLRAWVRHRAALQKTRTQQSNRLQTTQDATVRASLQTLISAIDTEIEHITTQIETLVHTYDDVRRTHDLLVSIPGMGSATATLLMAEMYDLAEYEDARAAAADAGVTPSHYQSGTSVKRRPRLSKVGKATVRAALYWPAITAMRHNPLVKALTDRLAQRGKSKKVQIGAAMRKLLHLAYGVLKHQTPFDPAYSA